MNSTVVVRANAQAEPSLIVFGRDDAGKPRASWFDAGSADLASKAADLMKMRVLRVETEEQKAVARQLAPGRVFASGRAFTPFARASGVQPTRRARRRTAATLPRREAPAANPVRSRATDRRPRVIRARAQPRPRQPTQKAGPRDRKVGMKSASAASCSRPSEASRTDGGKASSSASTAKHSP